MKYNKNRNSNGKSHLRQPKKTRKRPRPFYDTGCGQCNKYLYLRWKKSVSLFTLECAENDVITQTAIFTLLLLKLIKRQHIRQL